MLLALVLTAFADVPPPPGYEETCTVARACEGRAGVLCGDSYFGDRDACETKWAGEGYEKACSTRGASTWDEVWCQTAGTGEATPAAEEGHDEPAPDPSTAAEREPPPPSVPVPTTPAEPTPSPAEPEPAKTSRCSVVQATPWSVGLLLPMLAVFARRRRS